jgi:Fur family ferric uptake transcriptional regulator
VTATVDPWEERARRTLTAAGYRTGGAREAVVSFLADQQCARSAQEIGDELRARGNAIGIASVYRALDALEGMGLVQRVEVPEGGARFEPVVPGGEHHHHAVCERCGRLTPFVDERLEAAIERVAGRLPHEVSSHDVVIRGTCRRCARKR